MEVPAELDGRPLDERCRADVERAAGILTSRDPSIAEADAVRTACAAFTMRHEWATDGWRRRGRVRLSGPDGAVVHLTAARARP